MKTLCRLLLVSAVGLSPLAAVQFSFKAVGGAGIVGGGDYSAGLKGKTEWARDFYDQVSGSFQAPERCREGEAVFAVDLDSVFSVGLSFGIRHMVSESEVKGLLRLWDMTCEEKERIRTKIESLPLAAVVSAHIPLGKSIRIAVEAGAENAWNRVEYVSRFRSEGLFPSREEYIFRGRKQSFGWRAAAGVEVSFLARLAVVAEICGRFEKLDSLTGSYERSGEVFGLPFSERGEGHSLWYYQEQIGGKTYSLVAFGSSAPATAALGSSRPGSLSLSGVSFRAGLKYRL